MDLIPYISTSRYIVTNFFLKVGNFIILVRHCHRKQQPLTRKKNEKLFDKSINSFFERQFLRVSRCFCKKLFFDFCTKMLLYYQNINFHIITQNIEISDSYLISSATFFLSIFFFWQHNKFLSDTFSDNIIIFNGIQNKFLNASSIFTACQGRLVLQFSTLLKKILILRNSHLNFYHWFIVHLEAFISRHLLYLRLIIHKIAAFRTFVITFVAQK